MKKIFLQHINGLPHYSEFYSFNAIVEDTVENREMILKLLDINTDTCMFCDNDLENWKQLKIDTLTYNMIERRMGKNIRGKCVWLSTKTLNDLLIQNQENMHNESIALQIKFNEHN